MRLRRSIALALPLLLALATGPDAASRPSRREIPKIFAKIQKHWKSGDVDKLAKLLPPKGKVKLALRGVTSKAYRREQAHALLKKYFKAIETKEFKLVDGLKGTSGQYKHVFIVKDGRHKETRYTFIALDREGDQWVIVEIIED